jgi:S-adenosylmethionine hydrolase
VKIVTLLTDFGVVDTYVAQMKGVIYSLAPQCSVVDLTHAIAPQDIAAGAAALRDTAFLFPPGTVHVAVIDPGVGTDRRLMAAEVAGHFFVLPDNGLLSLLLEAYPLQGAVELTRAEFWRSTVSRTFHGRDILAPVAAQIVNGRTLAELGGAIGEIQRLAAPRWEKSHGGLAGVIVSVDHFGNAITNFPERLFVDFEVGASLCTVINGRELQWKWCTAYGFAPRQSPIALVGSNGCLELAINCGSAAAEFQLRAGDPVLIGNIKFSGER